MSFHLAGVVLVFLSLFFAMVHALTRIIIKEGFFNFIFNFTYLYASIILFIIAVNAFM